MRNYNMKEDEYLNEADGLIWCKKCGGPRQIRVPWGIYSITPMVLCACQQMEIEKEKKRREREEYLRHTSYLREKGLGWKALENYRFDKDLYGKPVAVSHMKRLTDNFPELPVSGYLLWGDHGTGKTFAAACAVNELIDRGIPAAMNSLTGMADEMTAMSPEEQQEYLNRFFSNRLICIDDLNFHEELPLTAKMKRMIMGRWIRSNRTSIFTTAYSLKDLKNPENEEEEVIFGELLSRCVPITCTGPDLRKRETAKRLKEMKSILI